MKGEVHKEKKKQMERVEEAEPQMGLAQTQEHGTAIQPPTGRSLSFDRRLYRIVFLAVWRSLPESLSAAMPLVRDWMVVSFGVSGVLPRVVSKRPGLAALRGCLASWGLSGRSASSALRGGARALEVGDDMDGFGGL